MAAEPFAGVTIPDDVGSAPSGGSESAAPENLEVSGQQSPDKATQSTQTTAERLADLDKLERVRFGGKELSVKELRESLMRQSDYTKKTKELAETRKYSDNFAYDFAKVVRDPSLIGEFKKIYPAQYHALVEEYLKEHQSGQSDSIESVSDVPKGDLPPEVQRLLDEKLKPYEEKFQKLDAWEQNVKEQETKAISDQLDALHDRFGKRYPFADPDLVDFRVQIAKEKGVDITRDNLPHVYEQVYKGLHEAQKSRLDAEQKTKVTEQVKAGQAAKDVGGGTGIPSAPPKKYSKFSEITKDALEAFGGK